MTTWSFWTWGPSDSHADDLYPAWYGHEITLNSQESLRSSRKCIGPEKNMQTEKEICYEELDYMIMEDWWQRMVCPKFAVSSGRLETQWYRASLKLVCWRIPSCSGFAGLLVLFNRTIGLQLIG